MTAKLSYRQIIVLFVLVVVCLMINIDFTAVNLALVSVSKDFHVKLQLVQWVVSGYLLIWVATCIPSGRLADTYGRRRTFLCGLVFFTVASAVCGAAPNVETLIIARAFQGLGGGLLMAPIFNLVFVSFPPERHGWAVGFMSGAIGLGLAVGPPLGGAILHYLDWRWIFFINVPLGILAVIIVMRLIPKEPWRISDKPLPIFDMLLIMVVVLSLVLGINTGAEQGVTSLLFIVLAIMAIGSLALFCYRQLRLKHPLVNIRFFKNPSLVGCISCFFLFQVSLGALLVILALYLQNIVGLSAFSSGLMFMALTAIWGLVSPYGGQMTDTLGSRLPVVAGLLILGFGLFLFGWVMPNTSIVRFIIYFIILGMGCALCFPALNALILVVAPEEHLSVFASLFVTMGLIGNPLSFVLSSYYYSHLTLMKVLSQLHSKLQLTTDQVANLTQVINKTHFAPQGLVTFSKAVLPQLTWQIKQAYTSSMHIIMLTCAIILLFAAVLAMVLIQHQGGRKNKNSLYISNG
ncbi:MAG: DHA2 family efflux MFS transporter permease subunit [Gammaproteobacteria bacterium]|nr:DHA2 family efflux MFS transporter permease subunit [Gammaproteobacteria bacterium]